MTILVNYSFTALVNSDPDGDNTVTSQAVEVRNELDGALATIYSDSAGASPISQPGAQTDSNGVLEFWVSPGYYTITSGARTENVLIDHPERTNPDTVADAKSSVHLKEGEILTTKGSATAGDGGGTKFIVVAGGTGTDDGAYFHDMNIGTQLQRIIDYDGLVVDGYTELDAIPSAVASDGVVVELRDQDVSSRWVARTGFVRAIPDKVRAFGDDGNRYWERLKNDYAGLDLVASGRRVVSLFENTDVKLFAHREMGYTEWNTVSEFSYALHLGADGLELDIQRTSDGELVVWHDSDLNTRTNGSGSVQSNTLAQVRAAQFTSLSGTAYEDEQIAKLSEIFELVRESGCMVIAEVKNFGTQAEKDATVDETVQLAMDYGILEQTFFAAFSTDLLTRAIEYNPNINIIWYLTNPSTSNYDSMNNFKNWGMRIVGADFNGGGLTKANIDYGRSIGVGTATYTTANAIDIRDAKNLGCNMIITDRLPTKLGGKR